MCDFRQMKKLEDDIYSFGFILLEALVGPSTSAKKEATVLNAMVCIKHVYIKINSQIFTEVLIYKLILHTPICRLPSIVKMTGNK
jgi:hypothetical protein